MAEATKKSYKATLNLPKTSFPMKANLVQNEPASLKRWQQAKLYEQVRAARKDAPRFSFHDGPPYANGSIHLGHLLNKVLKDFVVRSRTMMGFDVPYIPGWDCHGQPIEHRVIETIGPDKAHEMAAMQIRKRCQDYAAKFIKLQATQMQRLLTLADYEHPYITMDPAYEAAVLEVFAELVGQGLVYRDLKPVHWSIANRTALAEAELEYYDRQDTSVYVLFEVYMTGMAPVAHHLRELAGAHLLIWTTTPWTLPANLAVAVHPDFQYGLYELNDGRRIVIAVELAGQVLAAINHPSIEPLHTYLGKHLVRTVVYQHPFVEDQREREVVAADYVTLEDGTGLVHTAPGHGKEDYETAKRIGIDIYCPVKDDGTYDDTAPDWLRGKSVWEGNDLVVQRLRDSGHLFHDHKITHSYPHDWRGKTPTIFRATEQWFISVDKSLSLWERVAAQPPGEGAHHNALGAHAQDVSGRKYPHPSPLPPPEKGEGVEHSSLRDLALQKTARDVTFIPEWGRNRMRGMLESRPDWCISRQRNWGLPIPAFFPPENVEGPPLLTRASVLAVASVLRKHGSDYWFTATPEQLLAEYDPAADPDAPDWIKIANRKSQIANSQDIFDVWFESGSSWHAVIRQRFGADWYPTDLYLEGSDQHRGWFQLSLLPALGVTGQPPFRGVLTHGFMVDKDGRKMSKSLGNTLEVEDLLKEFGADVCRWWVASLNVENDIKVDHEFFRVAGEDYRKVRNTLRFILSNLGDFSFERDKVHFEDMDAASIDAWATRAIIELSDTVRSAYDAFDYRRAHGALFEFCNETMSAIYLAAIKDRLYCDLPDARRRRRTQTTLYRIADVLIRLLAPILPHTADEAWRALLGEDAKCVHLTQFADVDCMRQIPVHRHWVAVASSYRDAWLAELEKQRQASGVENPLDCGIRSPQISEAVDLRDFDPVDLADLCGVSQFEIIDAGRIEILDLRSEARCERSWKRDGTVKQRSDGGMLSDRDAAALGLA